MSSARDETPPPAATAGWPRPRRTPPRPARPGWTADDPSIAASRSSRARPKRCLPNDAVGLPTRSIRVQCPQVLRAGPAPARPGPCRRVALVRPVPPPPTSPPRAASSRRERVRGPGRALPVGEHRQHVPAHRVGVPGLGERRAVARPRRRRDGVQHLRRDQHRHRRLFPLVSLQVGDELRWTARRSRRAAGARSSPSGRPLPPGPTPTPRGSRPGPAGRAAAKSGSASSHAAVLIRLTHSAPAPVRQCDFRDTHI